MYKQYNLVFDADKSATTKFGHSSRGSTAAVEALANAAFPTLPPEAHQPQVSLFDLDDVSSASPIIATLLYGLFPINEKRGKVRVGYMILDAPLIEIHKSQKDHWAGKAMKHFINLDDVFNVCLIKEPFQIKDECLSIMVRDDTFYLRPINTEYSIQNWFEYVLEKCRAMRSIKFARPVFREEFFEVSWDAVVGVRPKLKKDYGKLSKLDDLGQKMAPGRRRICVQGSSVMIFRAGVMPNGHSEVPFERETFINLPSYVISSFANQEHYIILRTGRLSEVGSGELYMRCESHISALTMRDAISDVLKRDSERRKAQGIEVQSWMSSSNARAMKRRMNNAETYATAEAAETRSRRGTNRSQSFTARKTLNNATPCAESRKYDASAPNVKTLKAPAAARKKSFIAGLLPSFRLKLGSNASAASRASGIDPSLADEPHSPLSTVALPMNLRSQHGNSASFDVASTPLAAGVPRLATSSTTSRTVAGLPQLVYGSSSYDYMLYDPRDSKYRRVAFDDASRKGSASFSGILTHSYSQPQSASATVKRPPRGRRKRGPAGGDSKDYLEMDDRTFANSDSYLMPPSSLEDSPRSMSSLASNVPRAHLMGAASRTVSSTPNSRVPQTHHSNDEVHERQREKADIVTDSVHPITPSDTRAQTSTLQPTTTPADLQPDSDDDFSELRKRAHSLGSKSWKKPSFLNIGCKRHGTRLAAPAVGLSAPPSAVPSPTTGNLPAESRIRTDSDGSNAAGGIGVLSRIGRQNSAMTTSRSTQADGDHVEFDFNGSCPSIESPMNRSRNSSLGVQLPSNVRASLDLALHTHRAARAAAAAAAERQQDGGLQARQPAAAQSTSNREEGTVAKNILEIEKNDVDDYVVMELGAGSSGFGISAMASVQQPPSYCYAPIDTILESSDSSIKDDASLHVGASPAAVRRFVVGSDDESIAGSKERKPKMEKNGKSGGRKRRNHLEKALCDASPVVSKPDMNLRESSLTRKMEAISLRENTEQDRTSSQTNSKSATVDLQNSAPAANDDYGMFTLEPSKTCFSSTTSLASSSRTRPTSLEVLRGLSFNSSVQ